MVAQLRESEKNKKLSIGRCEAAGGLLLLCSDYTLATMELVVCGVHVLWRRDSGPSFRSCVSCLLVGSLYHLIQIRGNVVPCQKRRQRLVSSAKIRVVSCAVFMVQELRPRRSKSKSVRQCNKEINDPERTTTVSSTKRARLAATPCFTYWRRRQAVLASWGDRKFGPTTLGKFANAGTIFWPAISD